MADQPQEPQVRIDAGQGDLTIRGDVVGRDKIVNNIQNIVERALTAAEALAGDRALEQQALARGVSAFAARLQAIAGEPDASGPGNPYPGLASYRLADAESFFGRTAALVGLARRLMRGPLTVLHAEAGAGKSSLLQAGLAPRLITAGHLPVYLRAQSTNPSLLIKRAFLADPGEAPLLATASLHDFLLQVGEVLGPETSLVVIVDQAEKLFTQVDEGGRAEFIADLAECLGDPSLNVRWLLSVRSASFDQLAGFQPQVKNPLENESHFGCLSRAEAADAILLPARRHGLEFEPGLVDVILDDLGGHDIPPAQLQLVCGELFESRPAEARSITRAQYDAASRAAGILERYAVQALARDIAPSQRALAHQLLAAVKEKPGPASALAADRPPAEPVQATLDQMVDSRLLRVVQPDPLSGATEVVYTSAAHRLPSADAEPVGPEALASLEALLRPAAAARPPAPPPPAEAAPPAPVEAAAPSAPAEAAERPQGQAPAQHAGHVTLTVEEGDLTILGDVVGRDKIINNIQNIYQRALTAAEEAAGDRALELQVLAQGVSALARRLQVIAGDTADTQGGSPYKGLLSYRLSDAELFFGRSQAIATVLRRLQRGPLTVLHSESGAGKSSLIQAGLAPHLIAAGHLPLYLRPYNANPVQIIKRAFIADPSSAPLLATAPLREFLRQVSGVLGSTTTLFVILDQAEELFTQLDEDGRSEFIAELAECLDDPSLPVRWVLSLRTEFFGSLANFRPQVQSPFENDFRLNRLTHAEAAEVVVEPARRAGLSYEPGLVDELLGDLGRDNLPPPQLQLVCSGLYDGLPLNEKTITRAQYAAAGGASGILRDHLARVMGRNLKPAQRPIAQRLLEALITTDGRRAVRSLDELHADLAAGQLKGLAMEALVEVLDQLVDSRLLRAQEKDESAAQAGLAYELASGLSAEMASALAYELAHDYLLEQIRLDPDVQARKAAQELLDQEVRTYQRYQTLLTPERLAVIAPHRASLRLTPEAEQLLEASEAEVEREKRAEEARRQKELEDARKLAESERQRAEEQTRARSRAQRLTAVIGAVGIVAVIAAVVAVFFNIQATRSEQQSRSRRHAADATRNLELDPELSILLALQAVRVTESQHLVLPEVEAILHRAVESSLVMLTFTGHGDAVGNVAFSPDGRYVATASDDGTALVWECADGTVVLTLAGHAGPVSSVAYSPDGARLATASEDGTVKIWDAATGQEQATLAGHDGIVWDVIFSPDGTRLASGGLDGSARVWDAATGEELLVVLHEAETPDVFGVAFSPDGARLATASADFTARVWDVATGEELLVLETPEVVSDVAFSPDGSLLATANGDQTVGLWDAATGVKRFTLYGHTDQVTGVAFSPDGARLASTSFDRTVRLWETATGRPLFKLGGHAQHVLKAAFSPAGDQLITSSSDGTVKIWDVSLPVHTDWIFGVAYSPDGKSYVTASRDGTARVWDAATRQVEQTLNMPDERVYQAAFSPDGGHLVTASGNPDTYYGMARVWDLATGEVSLALEGHTDVVYGATYSPDGQSIATASWDGSVILWDAATGEVKSTFVGAPLIGGQADGALMRRVAFSPDGTKLAASGDDGDETQSHGSVWVWDVASGDLLFKLADHTDLVFGVAFSPDGQRIATAGWDGTARVWDAATGAAQLSLTGHTGVVWDVAFSADSARLATAGSDAITIIWKLSSGQQLITLAGHNGAVHSLAYSPDNDYLAAASADRTVRFYILPIDKLVEYAHSRLTRGFTTEECEAYMNSSSCPSAP